MMDNLRDYITTIETGKRPAGGAESSGVPSLSAEHMDKDGHLHFGSSKMKYVSEDYYETLKTGKLRDGDIVLVKDGATTGKVAFVDEVPVDKACINEHCFILRANENLLNEYLFFYLFSPIGNARVLDSYKGATIGGIGKSFIDMPIRVPSLEKQKQIVSILRKQRHIIALYNRQLESLDSLIKSRFVEMFGDCRRNPKGWHTVALGDISMVGSSKRVFVEDLQESGIPFYRGTEVGALAEGKTITPELFISEEHYKTLIEATGKPKTGDLLMPSICPDGRIWVINSEKPFYFKDGRVLWIHDINAEYDPVFLLYTLKDRIMTDYGSIASGTTFAELKIFALKQCRVFDVPLEEQKRFVAFVAQIDKSKAVIQKSLNEAQLLFDSLMQEYFG